MSNEVKLLTLGHVGLGTGKVEPFDQVFSGEMYVKPDDIREGKIDCLVIWGGQDISPSIYGEEVGPKTYASATPSYRDRVELDVIKAAIDMQIPIIGVCRGAQLLCAVAGGKLVQDVQGHGRQHKITTIDAKTLTTSSVHHQMMYPFDLPDNEWELIAWSQQPQSESYIGVNVEAMKDEDGFIVEPEIVYFSKIKGLAIQGHPEFMDAKCEFVQYCNELVRIYLLEGSRL